MNKLFWYVLSVALFVCIIANFVFAGRLDLRPAGNPYRVRYSTISARDSGGLFLLDDGGNGIYIEDGGHVRIGASPYVPNVSLGLEVDTQIGCNSYRSILGKRMLELGIGDKIQINSNKANCDFEVKGDTSDNVFWVDAGTEFVGIKTATPATALDVNGVLTVSTITCSGEFIGWLGADKEVNDNDVTTSVYYVCSKVLGNDFKFILTYIPYKLFGSTITINEISIYCNTQSTSTYISEIDLFSSDLDGTGTTEIAYTTDIGNGSTGDTNANIVTTPYKMKNTVHVLYVNIGASATDLRTDIRIYGFKIRYTIAPD